MYVVYWLSAYWEETNILGPLSTKCSEPMQKCQGELRSQWHGKYELCDTSALALKEELANV